MSLKCVCGFFLILGDFAILLKSGLTFRQAVTYNVASAIISYIGLVLGIIIGDIHSAHSWVLALTAGMFLYVSLVDMVSHVIHLNVLGYFSLTGYLINPLRACPHIKPLPVNAIRDL